MQPALRLPFLLQHKSLYIHSIKLSFVGSDHILQLPTWEIVLILICNIHYTHTQARTHTLVFSSEKCMNQLWTSALLVSLNPLKQCLPPTQTREQTYIILMYFHLYLHNIQHERVLNSNAVCFHKMHIEYITKYITLSTDNKNKIKCLCRMNHCTANTNQQLLAFINAYFQVCRNSFWLKILIGAETVGPGLIKKPVSVHMLHDNMDNYSHCVEVNSVIDGTHLLRYY